MEECDRMMDWTYAAVVLLLLWPFAIQFSHSNLMVLWVAKAVKLNCYVEPLIQWFDVQNKKIDSQAGYLKWEWKWKWILNEIEMETKMSSAEIVHINPYLPSFCTHWLNSRAVVERNPLTILATFSTKVERSSF